MSSSYHYIRRNALIVSYIAIFLGLLVPKELVSDYIIWFGMALLIGGIPHGASDYLIFRQLWSRKSLGNKKLIFGVYYLLVTVAYGVLWYLNPFVAFAIFILISLYHFGQSNWSNIKFTSTIWQFIAYLLYGILVIGFPVLIYYQEATEIIAGITGVRLSMESIRWPILFLIFALNFVLLVFMLDKALISKTVFKKEIANIIILVLLFISTPLLIGFGIYFVFWHSSISTIDQVRILKQLDKAHSIRKHVYQLVPLTIISLLALVAVFFLFGENILSQENYLGKLFLFISIITVPHSILMDRFYNIQTTIH